MIPEFDSNGNLPPGIHEANFDEVVDRFSLPRSRHRESRTNKLRAFYSSFLRRYATRVYIDGSYVTNKLSPKDVDLVVFLPEDFDFESEAGATLRRYQRETQNFHLHIFFGREGQPREVNSLHRRVEYFQWNTRHDPPLRKGIILVRINSEVEYDQKY
jgi:hypothetical protein